MPDGIIVKTNLPDFKRQLQILGEDFEKKAIRAGVNAAAQVFKKLAVAGAPVLRTPDKRRAAGTLQRAIYVVRSRRQSGHGREHYTVGVRQGKGEQEKGRDAFYFRFLEGGWTPRAPGQRLRGGNRSKSLQRSRAGGQITQYRFLAPAFARGKDAALAAFTAKVGARIAAENAKRRA